MLARKLLESEIMNKPPLYFKLWGWMLLQAKFKPHNGLERGQFKTSISKMQDAMEYFVGYRKEKPTIKQIRGIYESLTKGSMIGTTKVTDGLIVSILNYEEYQDHKNYEGHDEGVHEGKSEGTPYYKKERERKEIIYTGKSALDFFAPVLNGIDKEEFIKTIDGIIYLRKTKQVTSGIIEKEIEFWNTYPSEIINKSITVYNKNKYWEKLKGEKYLRGIIRGKNKESEKHNSQSLSQKAF